MKYDLIVVGAGPGGATAAATAAREGLRTLLVERDRFPRDKVCGDAISGKSVEVLERLDLTQRVAETESIDSWGVLFGSPAGSEVEIQFRSSEEGAAPPGYICARMHFDKIIARRAAELGADLREGTSVEDLLTDDGALRGVRLQSEGGTEEVTAPLVVGADGAYSVVARKLGFSQLDDRHYYAGVRAYYSGVEGFRDGNYIELQFVDDAMPGYFWIFPMANGMANVGMGTLSARIKKDGIRLKSALQDIIHGPRFASRFTGAELVGRVRGWGLPLGSATRTMAGSGWMLVGDAASLIDPFTGEGIGNAMISGELAARWAVRAHRDGRFDETMLRGYEHAVHEALDDELVLSTTLRRLERWPWFLNTIIRKAERNPEVARTISSMIYDIDARKKLASPLFFLRLLAA